MTGHWSLSDAAEHFAQEDAEYALQSLVAHPNQYSGDGQNTQVLSRLVAGLTQGAQSSSERQARFRVVPFGPGSAFVEATRAGGPVSGNVRTVSLGRREASSVAIGSTLRDLSGFRGTVLVEGGHGWSHDWGIGMLRAITGDSSLSLNQSEQVLSSAMAEASELIRPQTVVFAASTSRALLGPNGTASVLPDLSRRPTAATPEQVEKWHELLRRTKKETVGSRELPLTFAGHEGDPAFQPGSGAAGGAAAVLASLNVPLTSTTGTLSTLLGLQKDIEQADVIVCVEPFLDPPLLIDSAVAEIAEQAAVTGTPVVVIAAECSLSRPERADLGIHGVSLVGRASVEGKPDKGADPFFLAGIRVGQTWLRGR